MRRQLGREGAPKLNTSQDAELYLSFAGIFHRPQPEISQHLEELIDLWVDEIGVSEDKLETLRRFCADFPPGESRLNALWEHYIPLFETGKVEAPPYASVYLGDEGRVMGKETFAVQDFYRMAGYEIGKEKPEIADHLAVELEFLALLARDGESELIAEFKRKHFFPFLRHILPRIRETRRPVYSVAAELLEKWQFNLKKEGDFVG